jgi:hypothetical protein
MAFLIVLAILIAVALFVSAPLRRPQAGAGEADPVDGRQHLAELEAEREAKYREIRDAELDHRMGKLSDADYEELDRALRAEAIEILRALDRAGAPSVEGNGSSGATIESR